MPNRRRAFWAEDYGDNVKTQRAVFDFVYLSEIPRGACHFLLLAVGYGRLRRRKILICPRFHLNKYNRPILRVGHHKVKLAGFAIKITGERSETFAPQKTLTLFFTPAAKPLGVSQ
jgi:hypothetical protein